MSLTRTRNIPASPHTVVSHGAPETERQTLGFGFFPKPHPPGLAFANARAPCCHRRINLHPPPPTPTTPQHHPTLPFHTARPKPSDERPVSVFWPKPRPLASRWRTRSPPAAFMSLTRTHNLPVSSHTAVTHGTPETKPQTLGFGFLAPTPSSASQFANPPPHHHHFLICAAPPPPSITPGCHF